MHGRSLEGNLSEDSPIREVGVYLPPGYSKNQTKRYPVVYMLHGFNGTVAKRFEEGGSWLHLPSVLDRGLARPGARELIVVMPDAYTRFGGSMYSVSATTGDWERFIAEELVAYIDSQYRTLPGRASRGLAGHSMGGYGTLRIGMKYPEVFSALYALSPCCLAPFAGDLSERAEKIQDDEDVRSASFGIRATLARAAAWAPNPTRPPFYLDLPTRDGEPQPEIAAKFTANAPLAFIDQFIGNLRQYNGLAIDSGDDDGAITASLPALGKVLTDCGIDHSIEIYPGNHTSGAAVRIETKMLEHFARHLRFEQ